MRIFERYLLVFILFLTVIILFFLNVISGKKTLLSYGPKMYPEKNVTQRYLKNTLQDEVAPAWIDVPYSAINHIFFKKLKLPLWNQYSAIGYPLAADMESSAFFPLQLPSILGPRFWDFYLISRLILAMLFLYLFLKEIQLKTIPAVLGAFLYSFSGYFIYYINIFHLNVDMLLPVSLFFVIRYSKKSTILNFLLVILTFFLILNGGNPQASFLGLFFIDSYYLFLVLTKKENGYEKMVKIRSFLLINFISLGLSAFNYFLFLELYRNAWTIHPNGVASVNMSKIALSNFVFPYLIGYLKGSTFNNIMSTRIIPYFGTLATWLMFIGIYTRSHKRDMLFFATIFCLWFLKLVGFLLFEPILKQPLITNIWFNKYTATLFLSSSILSAIGFNTLIDFLKINRGFKKIKIFFGLIYPLLISTILFFILEILGGYLGLKITKKSFLPQYIDTNFILNYVSNQKIIASEFFKWERIFIIIAIFLSLFILVIVLITKKYRKQLILIFSFALFFLIIGESYLYFPKIRSNKFNPAQKFPYVDFLKKDKGIFRIYGTEQTAMPQENLFFGINDIRIVSPLLYDRYASFFRELLINQPKKHYHPFLGSRDTTMDTINNNLLSLLNVKYVLSNNYFSTKSIYELVYDNDVKIYSNKNFLPRVFLIDQVKPGLNQKQIFSFLKNVSFLPNKEAIVEGVTNDILAKLSDVQKNEDVSTAIIKQYDSNKVVIDVIDSSAKLLVLSDLYYPGWRVFVDGKEKKIYPTNYIMRGVFIPKGHHTVEFIYHPKSFFIGILISLLTVGFTIIITKIKFIKFDHN